MNLAPALTGNLTPTCGPDGTHRPLNWSMDGNDVRVLVRPNQPVHLIPVFVLTDVAVALGYKDPKHAARTLALVEGEDFWVESVSTQNYVRKVKVLTWKGVSKFLMRSDKVSARRFQDWLASKSSDLAFYGIAFRDRSATEAPPAVPSTDPALLSILAGIQASIQSYQQTTSAILSTLDARLTRLEQGGMPQTSTHWVGSPARQLPLSDLPAWSMGDHNRMRGMDYSTSSEFLARELGIKPSLHASSRLTRCAGNYCRAHGLSAYRFREGHSKTRIYLPRTVLALVHRTGWTKRTAALAEAQGELFGQGGDLRPPAAE